MSLSEDVGAEQADGKNTYSQDVAVEQTEQAQSEDVQVGTKKTLGEDAVEKTERPKRVLTPAGLRRAKLHDLETEYTNVC